METQNYNEFFQYLKINYKEQNLKSRYYDLFQKVKYPITKSGDGIQFATALDESAGNYYSATQLHKAAINIRDKYMFVYDYEMAKLNREAESRLETMKRAKEISSISAEKIKNKILLDEDLRVPYEKLVKTKNSFEDAVNTHENLVKAWDRRCKSLEKLASITNLFIIKRA